AVALGVDVKEIGPPVGDDALGAQNRGLDLAGFFDDLALDPERAGGLCVIDVRAADIAGHVAPGRELPSTVMPDAIALVVVTPVVEHAFHPRRGVARLAPQGLRAREAEAAVADHGNARLVGPRQLDAERRRHAPAENVRTGPEIFLVGTAE